VFTPGFHAIETLPHREIMPGVRIRVVAGEHLMLCVVDLDDGATVPTHQHPHEQSGCVLAGHVEMWIGDERQRLGSGDAYLVPGGTAHGARATGGPARVLDAFHPVRQEYLALFRGS
jgi:quercetin dioxygenase-like cupin family protein